MLAMYYAFRWIARPFSKISWNLTVSFGHTLYIWTSHSVTFAVDRILCRLRIKSCDPLCATPVLLQAFTTWLLNCKVVSIIFTKYSNQIFLQNPNFTRITTHAHLQNDLHQCTAQRLSHLNLPPPPTASADPRDPTGEPSMVHGALPRGSPSQIPRTDRWSRYRCFIAPRVVARRWPFFASILLPS